MVRCVGNRKDYIDSFEGICRDKIVPFLSEWKTGNFASSNALNRKLKLFICRQHVSRTLRFILIFESTLSNIRSARHSSGHAWSQFILLSISVFENATLFFLIYDPKILWWWNVTESHPLSLNEKIHLILFCGDFAFNHTIWLLDVVFTFNIYFNYAEQIIRKENAQVSSIPPFCRIECLKTCLNCKYNSWQMAFPPERILSLLNGLDDKHFQITSQLIFVFLICFFSFFHFST